jgi:hypothetical protein
MKITLSVVALASAFYLGAWSESVTHAFYVSVITGANYFQILLGRFF